jgi:flavin reductase (DIM6/NTAB) family NADH-FMN oxidoreductase RutF
MTPPIDAQSIDDTVTALMRAIDAPLIVATAAADGQRAGCVVGFHSQCSISPLRYSVWVSKANHTYRVALFATHVAVHLLGESDHDLIELFGGSTGDDVDKFEHLDWAPGPDGVPVLARCGNRMVLRRVSLWDDGGDHVCFIGEPVEAAADVDIPKLARVTDADDVDPGHGAGGRPTPNDLSGESTSDTAATASPDDPPTSSLEDVAAGAGHPIDLDDVVEP